MSWTDDAAFKLLWCIFKRLKTTWYSTTAGHTNLKHRMINVSYFCPDKQEQIHWNQITNLILFNPDHELNPLCGHPEVHQAAALQQPVRRSHPDPEDRVGWPARIFCSLLPRLLRFRSGQYKAGLRLSMLFLGLIAFILCFLGPFSLVFNLRRSSFSW